LNIVATEILQLKIRTILKYVPYFHYFDT